MAIDTSIYNALRPAQFESPVDAYSKVAQIQQTQNQNKLVDLTMQQHQRDLDSDNVLAGLVAKGLKPEDVVAGLAQQGYGNKALAYSKQQQELLKQQADIGKTKAETTDKEQGVAVKRNEVIGQTLGALMSVPNVNAQHVSTAMQHLVDIGVLAPEMGQKIVSSVPQDPSQMAAFLKTGRDRVMSSKDQRSYTDVDANTVANNKTSLANNAATNATSRANNAATIAKDYAVAGMNKDGTSSADVENTARAIASGQLPPPSGMALTNPKNQRILSRVMEINPDYDYTTVSAKKKAAADFTSGQQGNAMRSFAVATDHLGQLNGLIDALDNGSSQLINKAKNAYQSQTGQTAPTNFDAAKGVISKEVINAIVAGGSSGVDERKELESQLSNAKSPAQLKGVIDQWTGLMQAKQNALLQQRRAAGLSDSTLPKYTESAPAKPSVPSVNAKGWALHRDSNGNQAYVSPDGKQYEEVK